jgi:hypothetical protein
MVKVTTNFQEFNARIEDFIAANPGRILTIQKKLMLDAFERLISYTPRKDGYLANNWQATNGFPANGTVGKIGEKVPPPDSTRVLLATATLKPYEKSWLTNNAIYSERINDGWASYQGAQMLERAVNDIKSTLGGEA